jgi:hypothetical protein
VTFFPISATERQRTISTNHSSAAGRVAVSARWLTLGVALCTGACASSPPPAPAPAPVEAPSPQLLSPSSVSGSYRLQADIQSQHRGRSRRRAVSTLILGNQALAVPIEDGPGQGFTANIALPGYTQPPRGRTTQSAAWWPIDGDSVVVQFSQGEHGQIQLRGAVTPRTIAGEIWYVSASGSTFQLGTFTAQKRSRR